MVVVCKGIDREPAVKETKKKNETALPAGEEWVGLPPRAGIFLGYSEFALYLHWIPAANSACLCSASHVIVHCIV